MLRILPASSYTALLLLLFCSCSFNVSPLSAQTVCDWGWVNPRPVGTTLNAVKFSDRFEAVAVGNFGTVVRTWNTADEWHPTVSGTDEHLQDLWFLDENRGFAVGDNGTLLYTPDGGTSWQPRDAGTSANLKMIFFLDDDITGFIGGEETLLRTTDGGTSWDRVETTGLGLSVTDVFNGMDFYHPDSGYVVGNEGMIGYTTDGGASWTCTYHTPGFHFESVAFANNRFGTIVGNNSMVLTTTNANVVEVSQRALWQRNWGIGGRVDFYDVTYPARSEGYAAAQDGRLYVSRDTGLTWRRVRLPLSNTLKSITFWGNEGIAVGAQGASLRTFIRGNPWNQYSVLPDTSITINSLVWAREEENHPLMAACSDGLLLYSFDDGSSWDTIVAPTDQDLYDLYVVPGRQAEPNGRFLPELMVVVGDSNLVMRTEDFGETWQTMEENEIRFDYTISRALFDIHPFNEDTLLAAGEGGRLIMSGDRGRNWESIDLLAVNVSSNIRRIYTRERQRPDQRMEKTIYLIGEVSTLVISPDSTISWENREIRHFGQEIGVDFYDFKIVDNLCYAIGDEGAIMFTPVDGAGYPLDFAWDYADALSADDLRQMIVREDTSMEEPSRIVMIGREGDLFSLGAGELTASVASVRTRDLEAELRTFAPKVTEDDAFIIAGTRATLGRMVEFTQNTQGWEITNMSASPRFFSAWFFDGDEGLALGARGSILLTEDGGDMWEPLVNIGTDMYDVDFVNRDLGVLVGSRSTVVRTEDGGETWQLVAQGLGGPGSLLDVDMVDESVGYAVGNEGKVAKTLNGGLTWNLTGIETFNWFHGCFFLDEDYGFVVGDNGSIYRTSNGGASWDSTGVGTAESLRDVYFWNTEEGMVVGRDNAMYRTENGGDTWENVVLDLDITNFNAIDFLDVSTGYVAGDAGTLLKTTDGGRTWQPEQVDTRARLYSIQVLDENLAYITGESSVVLKLDCRVVDRDKPLAQSQPLRVYPNPTPGFLTVTIDQAQLPAQAQVFDLSGRLHQVRTLEQQETRLDLEALPSGVYILKVGRHHQKLILDR